MAKGAARGKLMVATASSMEFRLAATSGRKLHARIHDDAAAASRHSMKVAFSDSLWHSSCVKMNWRLQLCFFNSYSNSIWRSSCVILNPSMQLPWRLKNCLLPLPIWFLSTWVMADDTKGNQVHTIIVWGLEASTPNFQPIPTTF